MHETPRHAQDAPNGQVTALVILGFLGALWTLWNIVTTLWTPPAAGPNGFFLVYTLALASLYLGAAAGLIRRRSWAWMILLGVSAASAWSLVVGFGSILISFGLRPGALLIPLVLLAFHLAVAVLALHPAVRRWSPPPPGAW